MAAALRSLAATHGWAIWVFLALLALFLFFLPAPVHGGANPNFTLPLHARHGQAENRCRDFAPVDCAGVRPTVEVPPGTEVVIYILLYNHNQVQGMQTAYQWDAGWVLYDCLINCRPGQVVIECDWSDPGGPVHGALSTAFNCTAGPALAPVGRIGLLAGDSGCLRQVESAYPNGIHLVDCAGGIDRIDPNDPVQTPRLGKICVGTGGHDACDPVTPVEGATWGRIKASYP